MPIPSQKLGRAANGQMLPGYSGNPGGKSKGTKILAQEILKRTHNGKGPHRGKSGGEY